LYDAADALLEEHAFEDVSVEDICARADVGRATFFRIYESKEGLLREFNRRLAHDAAERLEVVGEKADIRTSLHCIRTSIVDGWRRARPGHYGMARAFTASSQRHGVHSGHPELLALTAQRIRLAIANGELPDTIPVNIAASLALLQMYTPVAFAFDGVALDTEAVSRLLVEQWVTGIQQTAVPAPGELAAVATKSSRAKRRSRPVSPR
jgi:AcrR family transcriptional regulator